MLYSTQVPSAECTFLFCLLVVQLSLVSLLHSDTSLVLRSKYRQERSLHINNAADAAAGLRGWIEPKSTQVRSDVQLTCISWKPSKMSARVLW